MYNKLKNLKIPNVEYVRVSSDLFLELVHEPVTDVLYMCTNTTHLTPHLDPTTGLPMTLEKYSKLLQK